MARETAKSIHENKDKPFLAYLSFYSVHTPLMGPKDLVEKYKKKQNLSQARNLVDEEQVLPGNKPRKVRILQKHAVYAAMVEAMDMAVGNALKALDNAGVADNTVVFFTSIMADFQLPKDLLPVTFLFAVVRVGSMKEVFANLGLSVILGVTKKAGSVNDDMICSIDLFPTIMSAAGIDAGVKVDGIDLTPALKGQDSKRDTSYWHYPHYSNQGGIPGGIIRVGDYKLIERYEDGRVHLYNLKKDIIAGK